MRKFFASRGVDMPLNNLKQAMVPEGYVIVPNALGTAPGYRVQAGGKHVVVLPGVPREMKPMIEETVLPWLRDQQGNDVYLAHTFQTFGISESGLDELVAGIVDASEGRVSFRASFPEVSVRVVVHGKPEEATARLSTVAARFRERLGEYCYGEGVTTSMEEVVGRALRDRGWKLALAESCTGGLVGHRITAIPGSSTYFVGGVEAYANSAKMKLLGVRRETLEGDGAVSEACAGEMAAGARTAFAADVAVSTTGIAGPDGGTPEKPVGLVCFGLATPDGVVTRTHQLWGTRDWVKLLASQIALDMVRRATLGLPLWDPSLFRRR
jgi:nicotinamide-nucleotide amidase